MFKSRKLPPFAAIRAFESAARNLSFKDAAAEIHVTPSAISHQVKTLEEFLATKLFLREGNHIELTPTGRDYLGELTGLLDQLDDSTRRAAGTDAENPLTILCTPGFAARWLAPRLSFCPDHGRIQIEVSSGAPSTDFTHNGADVVIAWGGKPAPGAVVEPLMESGRYPVCSPGLKMREGLVRPADLLGQTLIYDEVADAWEKWFRLAGVPVGELPRGPRLPHCELTLTAAEQGQGVALAYDAMARGGLLGGELVRLFDITVPPITIYSVAYPEARARDPRIRDFRDWIFNEVVAEGTLDRQTRVLAAS
ncbi:MAG TPA: LysR substrate-binding domain-containing protein [Thermohalobaculum sp.]|nr:LysR substrate-binding domain-containing protein [Thermohalobaculum sp.]